MSSPEEKIKEANIKSLQELHTNNKRNEEQQAKYEFLLKEYGEDILKNPKLVNTEKETVYVAPQVPKDDLRAQKDLEALLKAYKEKTGRDPVETKQGIQLSFSTQKEAVAFFKEQSKELAFDTYCAKSDHRIYSDGKGTFVHGTQEQVSNYLKKREDFVVGKDGELKENNPEETNKYRV